MKQMCYVVKNVLIFKIADSCLGLLRGGLIYSGFIFSSWALLSAVVCLFHCVATVCVENLHFISYGLFTDTLFCPTADLLFMLQFVYGKIEEEKYRILCIECVWFLQVLCVYLPADFQFIRQRPKVIWLGAELCNCLNCLWWVGTVERELWWKHC